MEAIVIVIVLALLQFFFFSVQVGAMRGKHNVTAPTITGDTEFERSFRVHQNTMEQLVIFLPAIWLFGTYVDALWGAGVGLFFIIGRFVYRSAYLRDPSSRGVGFGMGAAVNAILLLGGLIGAVLKLV